MAGTVAALFRLAGAGFVLAREGAFAGIDPEAVPPRARLPLRLARLIERREGRRRGRAPDPRAQPARAVLRQARPVPRDAARHRRQRGRRRRSAGSATRSSRSPKPRRGPRSRRHSASRSTSSSPRSRRRSPPPPSPRSTRRRSATDDGPRAVAVKVLRPGIRQRFRRDLDTFYAGARFVERARPGVAPAPAGRRGRHARAVGDDRDGPPARGGRALGNGRGDRRPTRASACRRSSGS